MDIFNVFDSLSYSFNLLYLFILVMRNNIIIVESFVFFCFGFFLGVFGCMVFIRSLTKLIHNYKQYVLFFILFSPMRESVLLK